MKLHIAFTCDACKRPLTMGGELYVTPEMEKHDMHFCNRLCQRSYEHSHQVEIKGAFIAAPWPYEKTLNQNYPLPPCTPVQEPQLPLF